MTVWLDSRPGGLCGGAFYSPPPDTVHRLAMLVEEHGEAATVAGIRREAGRPKQAGTDLSIGYVEKMVRGEWVERPSRGGRGGARRPAPAIFDPASPEAWASRAGRA